MRHCTSCERDLPEDAFYDHDKRKLEEAERLINQEKEAASSAEEAAQGRRESLELDTKKGRP